MAGAKPLASSTTTRTRTESIPSPFPDRRPWWDFRRRREAKSTFTNKRTMVPNGNKTRRRWFPTPTTLRDGDVPSASTPTSPASAAAIPSPCTIATLPTITSRAIRGYLWRSSVPGRRRSNVTWPGVPLPFWVDITKEERMAAEKKWGSCICWTIGGMTGRLLTTRCSRSGNLAITSRRWRWGGVVSWFPRVVARRTRIVGRGTKSPRTSPLEAVAMVCAARRWTMTFWSSARPTAP
mmetsp:Transcript_2736/g.4982  ORF Transcript_2736/g.4982 Transcript_2736/m.4982 type:complete len:237 (+) Transcript_2736:779-1489(+)